MVLLRPLTLWWIVPIHSVLLRADTGSGEALASHGGFKQATQGLRSAPPLLDLLRVPPTSTNRTAEGDPASARKEGLWSVPGGLLTRELGQP